jgi:hypothetical protein
VAQSSRSALFILVHSWFDIAVTYLKIFSNQLIFITNTKLALILRCQWVRALGESRRTVS